MDKIYKKRITDGLLSEQTLKALAAKIDTEKMNAPSFMMVLTGVGAYAYTRTDGVAVVPISALGV